MGAVSKPQGGGMIYLGIYEGKLTQRLKEPMEGCVTRKNKNDVVVHEFHYDAWAGFVKCIYLKSPPPEHAKIGMSLAVILEDTEGVKAQIETSLTGGYAADIIKRLCNCDLHSEVVFAPYSFMDKASNKKRLGISLQQNGSKVENLFTKERAPQMPAWKEMTVNGQVVYDKTETLRYLLTKLRNKITKTGPQVLDLAAEYTQDGVAIKSDYVDLNEKGDAVAQMQQAPPANSYRASNIPNGAVPASALPPAYSGAPQPQPGFGAPQPQPTPGGFGMASPDAEDDLPF